MIDREKVIKGLECCVDGCDDECPYWTSSSGSASICTWEMEKDALALLKEQDLPKNASISSAIECLLHPQDADDSDMAKAIDTAVRAMRSLKAQEPVSPMQTNGHIGSPIWICGNCKSWIGNKTVSYCWHCGRAVKWE